MPPRLCVYTVLIGGYETLNEQAMATDSRMPFICLTDDPALTSETWQIRRIKPALPADPIRSARLAKLLAHQFLPEFDGSLYIDNAVRLTAPPETLIEAGWREGGMALPAHSFRETLNGEFEAVLEQRLDDLDRVAEQRAHYREIAPEILDAPVFWAAIMMRDHRVRAVRQAMEAWAAQVARYSRRDQLSLPMALHLAGLVPGRLDWDNYASSYHSWPHTPERKQERRVWDGVSRAEWQARAAALEEALQASQASHAELNHAHAVLEAALQASQASQASHAELNHAHAVLLRSSSWRMTAPLRVLVDKAKEVVRRCC